VELYLHFPTRLHDVVLDELSLILLSKAPGDDEPQHVVANG
jgi:hypothetical protein